MTAHNRFPELKGVLQHNVVQWSVAADREMLFEKVDLRHARVGDDGLRKRDERPETYRCVADVNVVGAPVIVAMARDYSAPDSQPTQCNPGWVTKESWKSIRPSPETPEGPPACLQSLNARGCRCCDMFRGDRSLAEGPTILRKNRRPWRMTTHLPTSGRAFARTS